MDAPLTTSFEEFNLNTPLKNNLSEVGYEVPTPIQGATYASVLSGQDVLGLAQTGTGKTLAYLLPILNDLKFAKEKTVRALVIVPTRELVSQVVEEAEKICQNTFIRVCGVHGGNSMKKDRDALAQSADIIVATPGRLADLVKREAVDITKIAYFILDEADEMVTALKEGLDSIIKEIPKARRTFLFTATMPGTIKQLVQNYMSKHVIHIEANMETVGHQGIEHQYVVAAPIEKLEVLLHFLNSKAGQRGIIFCKTKAAVNKLAKNLAINKFSSGAIHGSLTQGIRDRMMGQFRDGHIDILVATDLAARGIDVKDLSYVVNYHLPDTYDAYVHRSGRTARAGARGLSLTIIQKEEAQDISDFENALDIRFNAFKKADAKSIEESNGLIWANKIFKTKPNRSVSEDFKSQIKTIFHHLTKEELIEKVLANYIAQTNSGASKSEEPKKKKKK